MTVTITQQGSLKLVTFAGTTTAGGAATEDSPALFGEVLAVEIDGTDLSGTTTLERVGPVIQAPTR